MEEQKLKLIQNYGRPSGQYASGNYPKTEDLKFTPEAIASFIEQLRNREDIKISEIKDESDCVKVIGRLRHG